MRKPVIGVMCPGDNAPQSAVDKAFEVGELIAREGWVLLSGGRKKGAMNAVNEGAKKANGLTVGITVSNTTDETSEFVDIAIVTGMGSARNVINILSSNALIIIADGMGAGTFSEAALALKAKRQIVMLGSDEVSRVFFERLGKENVIFVNTPQEAIASIKKLL